MKSKAKKVIKVLIAVQIGSEEQAF